MEDSPSQADPPARTEPDTALNEADDSSTTDLADPAPEPPAAEVDDRATEEAASETPPDTQPEPPAPKDADEPANTDDTADTATATDLPPSADLDEKLRQITRSSNDVEARKLLSILLADERQELTAADRKLVREVLTGINKNLVYSKRATPGDPLVELYKIKSGDRLSRIARRFKTTDLLLARINGLASPDRIVSGRELKVIRGPFHAVIEKATYRLDLYLVDPAGQWIYINSMPVGLGEEDSTPSGKWVVKPQARVANPQYTDPRTGKIYTADDPKNPVGEYWIGLEGIEEDTADLAGYGIHGTIEPESIGAQASMGCIRLGKKDIELLYAMLIGGESTVTVKD